MPKTLSIAARVLLWTVLAVWSLFALTLGAIHLVIVPRIDEARPTMERWASDALGVPVKLGAIRALASNRPTTGLRSLLPDLVPSFELLNVQLFDPTGREALRLPEVQVAISARSLWRLGFEQLVIESPTLDVRRTAGNRLEVAGLDFSNPSSDDTSGADWFFSQAEFVIRNGTVRWTDDLRKQPPVALSQVDLVMRNTRRSHQYRLDATPPAEWGSPFSLRGRLSEPLIDLATVRAKKTKGLAPWHNWSGELYADFSQIDVSRLQSYVDLSPWGVTVRSGQGALRAWADMRKGVLYQASADVSLSNVATRLGPKLPELAIDSLQGRMSAQWSGQGFEVSSPNLQFRTHQGLVWPKGALHLKHQVSQGKVAAATTLNADQVELEVLASIATRLPLPESSRALLLKLKPAGRIEAFKVDWFGTPPASDGSDAADTLEAEWKPHRYRASGLFKDLALSGEPRVQPPGAFILPGRPGISGAQIEFDLNQDGGHAKIKVKQGSVDFPGMFQTSLIPLQRLETEARWRIKDGRVDAWLDKLSLANQDLLGQATVHWHTSDPATSPSQSRFPGVLDLSARIVRGSANRIHSYLPIAIGPEVKRYVQEAVRAGKVEEVDFRIRGDLWDMPFNRPGTEGEFRIEAPFQGVELAYVPSYLQPEGEPTWPALTGMNGLLVLHKASLKLSELSGSVEGSSQVRLSQGEVEIAHLGKGAVLAVSAHAKGPANEVVGFVRNSPVNLFTGKVLEKSVITGQVPLQFQLKMPFEDTHQTTVSGGVQFAGNDVHLAPEIPVLQNTHARLTFSERGFSIPQAKTQMYGGELQFSGGMAPDAKGVSRVQFEGHGTATAEGLRAGQLGLLSRLTEQAQGSAAYSAELGFRAGVPELNVSSDLVGMAVSLPAPLSKIASAPLPFVYNNHVTSVASDPAKIGIGNGNGNGNGEKAQTDRLFLQLGAPAQPLAVLDYQRNIAGNLPRVIRGSIAAGLNAGESVTTPENGVQANIRFARIDVDAWERAFNKVVAASPDAASPGASLSSQQEIEAAGRRYLPTNLAVRAEQLLVSGRTFNQVVVGGSREGDLWRANIASEQLNGYLEYKQPSKGSNDAAGGVYARLAKLILAPSAAADVEDLLQQPTNMPALDIEVDEFVLAGRHLGFVGIQARNKGREGRAREWQLTKLSIRVPEARFNAIGDWSLSPGGASTGAGAGAGAGAQAARRTVLQMELDVRDAGALLARFGQPGTVRGGQGTIRGSIGWVGSPMSLDYATMAGQLNSDFKSGQFLKVDPGAAKLLSVLSLQSLPRRLALDFRDVFSDGFAFDFVRGDVTIEQGVARTNNLQMKGVNAAVLMDGSADIAREQQDLKVVVVPEINAGTAALIATAINPAVGLGTFLAQFLLGQPLQSAATQEFHVTGKWADPQVEKVSRSAAKQAESRAPSPAGTPP